MKITANESDINDIANVSITNVASALGARANMLSRI